MYVDVQQLSYVKLLITMTPIVRDAVMMYANNLGRMLLLNYFLVHSRSLFGIISNEQRSFCWKHFGLFFELKEAFFKCQFVTDFFVIFF